jgi:16S rRNA (cytidine1402-2'-O)-methyltransferase
VIAVPGPSAAVAALSISGLPTDSFVFAGFLPAKEDARRRKLQQLAREPRTAIVYESAHRIAETLAAMVEVLGPARRVCLARELTKLYEDGLTAPVDEVRRWLQADENRGRGEFVLLIEGAAEEQQGVAEARRVLSLLLPEMGASKAAKIAAEITSRPRKELYALAVELGGHAAAAEREPE